MTLSSLENWNFSWKSGSSFIKWDLSVLYWSVVANLILSEELKETLYISLISSEPLCNDSNARFTTWSVNAFYGIYRYLSGLVIFEWRVTWNYAYYPFMAQMPSSSSSNAFKFRLKCLSLCYEILFGIAKRFYQCMGKFYDSKYYCKRGKIKIIIFVVFSYVEF